MKNSSRLPFLYLLTLLLGLLLTSCDRDGEVVSEEDVADLVEYSVSSDAAGLATQAEEAAKMADTYIADCGITGDSTITFSSGVGSLISYNYVFTWNWDLQCSGLVPTQFDLNYTSTGNFDAARLSSDDNSTATLTLTDLTGTSDLTLNGTFTRVGSQESKVRGKLNFSSTLAFILTDLKISKTSQEITGGNASFTASGSASDGTSFSHNGNVEFLGNQSATITINGQTYSVSL